MSECRHDWRAVGGPIDGAPPTRAEQHAWCRQCGALHTTTILGWSELVPMRANAGTTLADILVQAREIGRALDILHEIAGIHPNDLDIGEPLAAAIAILEGRSP